MYFLKKDIPDIFNQSAIAREVGLAIETVNRIFNRKQSCSKVTALCITKLICNDAEIEYYFEKAGE